MSQSPPTMITVPSNKTKTRKQKAESQTPPVARKPQKMTTATAKAAATLTSALKSVILTPMMAKDNSEIEETSFLNENFFVESALHETLA